MSVDIILPESSSWGGTNHWIASTGRALRFKIKVTVEDFPDGETLTGDSMFLEILPPLDDHFSSSETGMSNIQKNQGTCQYVIGGMNRKGETPTIVKIFELRSGIISSGNRYRTIYSNPRDSVVIGKDGYVYHDYDGDRDKVSKNIFAIAVRPRTGTVRPGDDLRFRNWGDLHPTQSYGCINL